MSELIVEAAGKAKGRGKQNAASLDAWENKVKPNLTPKQKAVLAVIQRYPLGITAKEVCGVMGIGFQHVSGRCAELKDQRGGYAVKGTGVRRDGSEVLVAVRPEQPGQQSFWSAA